MFVFAHREGHELDPDYDRVASIVEDAHSKVVLTNSPVVAYYLHSPRPHLDRAFGLGPGFTAACLRYCRRPFAIVDDDRVPPPRLGLRPQARVDDISVVIVRGE